MKTLACAALLATISLAAPAHADCLVTGQTPMTIATLYFGETISGHRTVTASQWARFLAETVTPTFPDGFTVSSGEGQWMDDKTHRIDHDPTKILTIAAPKTPELAGRLLHVMKAYEKAFNQEAVGVTTVDGCAGFSE